MGKYSTSGIKTQDLVNAKKASRRLSYMLYLAEVEENYRPWARCWSRVRSCSDAVWGEVCPECGKIHHMVTYGCHHLLCPICSVRRSRATAAQGLQVMAMLSDTPMEAYLLTLTQKSVCADALPGEIAKMLKAWALLRGYRAVRRDLLGWARTIEITKTEAGYHPHIHLVILMRPGSTLTTSEAWREVWRMAMGLEYEPICDTRPLTSLDAVYEVSKYVTKIGRMYAQADGDLYDQICAIAGACYTRRLRSYGGIWATARKEARMLDAHDMPDGALDAAGAMLEAPGPCCGKALIPGLLLWAGHDYTLKEMIPSET